MRTDAPASGGGFVNGSAHDRVTKPEPTWHVGVSDELDTRELVHRLQHIGLAHPGGCAREIDLERIARHRGALEHTASRRREKRQFLGQRGGHHRGYLHSREGHLAASSSGHRVRRTPGQLFEVERIAAGLLIEQLGVLTNQLARFVLG